MSTVWRNSQWSAKIHKLSALHSGKLTTFLFSLKIQKLNTNYESQSCLFALHRFTTKLSSNNLERQRATIPDWYRYLESEIESCERLEVQIEHTLTHSISPAEFRHSAPVREDDALLEAYMSVCALKSATYSHIPNRRDNVKDLCLSHTRTMVSTFSFPQP